MRHIRIFGLFLVVLSFWTITAHADIWDWASSSSSINAYNSDEGGYAYRGGVDFSPPAQKAPLKIGYSYDMGLGCGGLDLGASFTNFLTTEAAHNYVTNLGSAALAAAPMVLLEFASPTLADALKNFQRRAQDLLTLNQASCESITKAGEDLNAQLRAKGAKTAVSSAKTYDEIKAIASKPETGAKNFFGEEKDYYLIADGMKWAQADKNTSSRAVNLCGDFYIPRDGKNYKLTTATFTLNKLFTDYKDNYSLKLRDAILSFDQFQTVPDLKDVSPSTFPVTPELFRSIARIDPASGKRDLAIAKLSSASALSRVSHEVDEILFNFSKFDNHPELVPIQKEYMASKEDYLRKAKGDLIATKESEDKTAERVAGGIIDEYKTDRANAVNTTTATYLEDQNNEVFANPFGFGGIKR